MQLEHRWNWILLGPVLALLVLAFPGGGLGSDTHATALSPAPPTTDLASPTIKVADGQSVQTNSGGRTSFLNDTVGPAKSNATGRWYSVRLTTNRPLPESNVLLSTHPLLFWGLPQQLPAGLENLPSLGYWNWSVVRVGGGSPGSWTASATQATLDAVVPWENATYRLVGTASPSISVVIDPQSRLDTPLTSLGFTLHDPSTDGKELLATTNLTGVAAPLTPSIVRFGLSAVAGWNSENQSPKLNFTAFDSASQMAERLGAASYVSLPAGSWGDGNLLPLGMPLNLSVPMFFEGSTGYFPTVPAYVSFVLAVVNHSIDAGEPVRYWNIGNEVPLVNQTVVETYLHLFNAAASAIHSRVRGALVGSDVMLNRTYFATFAAQARGVGFLSFHYYPSTGLCVQSGTYCPPAGGANGTQDPALFRSSSDFDSLGFYGPSEAASKWTELTGTTLPVLDSETNLAGIGGSPATGSQGTDPRQQMLDGTAWLLSTLIRGSSENLSELTYFSLAGPTQSTNSTTWAEGGWGFGLTVPESGGTAIHYAPWWGLKLWAGVAAGAPVATTTSDCSVIQAVASVTPTAVRLLLVNRVDTLTTVTISGVTNGSGTSLVSVLDNRSYVEQLGGSPEHESLVRSGLTTSQQATSDPGVAIDGYGVALVVIPTRAVNSSGNGSSGNGSGTNSSGANGTGANGTGANGTGTNGSSTNGSGSNGSGTNGSGTNWSGENGSGSNGSATNGSGGSTNGTENSSGTQQESNDSSPSSTGPATRPPDGTSKSPVDGRSGGLAHAGLPVDGTATPIGGAASFVGLAPAPLAAIGLMVLVLIIVIAGLQAGGPDGSEQNRRKD
jgi:hypothetical protein